MASAYERRALIMKLLEKDGRVEITPLAAQLGVTRVTIRADLDALQMRGLLVRTHGGAVLPENQHLIRKVSSTLQEHREAKATLAERDHRDGS